MLEASSINNNQHQGETLRAILKNRDIKVPYMASEMEISKQALYKMLNKKKIKKDALCLICSLLGLSPSTFGHHPDHFLSDFTSREETNLFSDVILYNVNNKPNNGYQPFMKKYFDSVIHYVSKSERSIWIIDYFDKNRGINITHESYGTHHKKYFDALDRRLHNKQKANENFKYVRVAQLPLLGSTTNMELKLEQKQTFENVVDLMIEFLFLATYKHVWKCFNEYPDFFEFYLLDSPIRAFNYYIIDDEVIISEYDKYDKDGVPSPDMLFIDKANFKLRADEDPARMLIKHHQKDLALALKNYEFTTSRKQLSKEVFFNRTIKLYEKTEKELKKIKKKVKEEENILLKIKKKTNNNLSEVIEQNSNVDKIKKEYKLLKKKFNNLSQKKQILLNSL